MKTKRKLILIAFVILTAYLFVIPIFYFRIPIEGRSMEPTFTDDQYYYILKGIPEYNLEGKVIAYQASDGGYVMHRVIEDSGNTLLCKGDNPVTNPIPDPAITRNQIVGEYAFFLPLFMSIVDVVILLFTWFIMLLFIISLCETKIKQMWRNYRLAKKEG